TIGRAARNVNGRAILYADRITGSMQLAIDETKRRRKKQHEFNEANGIVPRSLNKKVVDIMEGAVLVPGKRGAKGRSVAEAKQAYGEQIEARTPEELSAAIQKMEDEMYQAARDLDFEKAAQLRDKISEARQRLVS
ncbi:MAG: UvrB/UvrC motif-containing protein, partial [Oleiphilaceae bacterium]|nr:UvrB/UvrC motif-containing protein [Oleiphilaceae bacterium]